MVRHPLSPMTPEPPTPSPVSDIVIEQRSYDCESYYMEHPDLKRMVSSMPRYQTQKRIRNVSVHHRVSAYQDQALKMLSTSLYDYRAAIIATNMPSDMHCNWCDYCDRLYIPSKSFDKWLDTLFRSAGPQKPFDQCRPFATDPSRIQPVEDLGEDIETQEDQHVLPDKPHKVFTPVRKTRKRKSTI